MKNNSDNQFYVVPNARFLEQISILIILIIQRTTKDFQIWWSTQYAHDVVLTSVRRRFNVMDVVWTSKRRRVFTEKIHSIFHIFFRTHFFFRYRITSNKRPLLVTIF